MRPHIVVALSSHGYGHIGQTAPIVEAFCKIYPDTRITLRTAAPRPKLIEKFGKAVVIEQIETDIGMHQANAQQVLLEESANAYASFHQDWEQKVEHEASALRKLAPDLFLANIPYLSLAAASVCEIPTVAMCSINWLDIYEHYFNSRPEAQNIMQQMYLAYSTADTFLQPEPSMPMTQLGNRRAIGPICQRGQRSREQLLKRIGYGRDERIVMVSLGGMNLRPPIEHWPTIPGVRLLVPASWKAQHPNCVDFESLGMPYIDVLWSCDALICKPGYGSFVEAACAGIPVLYLERPDWPEVPYLTHWLERVGRCALLRQERWLEGEILDGLDLIWNNTSSEGIEPTGIQEAVEVITGHLQ